MADSIADGFVQPSFADLVQARERGKLKLYIGSAAGTGKTFRMLTEAHELRRRGVDVVVGYIETHGRAETAAQVGDLEVIPRKRLEYRGVALEELDVDAVIARRPQVAVVDELGHTNVPGMGRTKRWEDVVALLDDGISVISALNVQHFESLNDVLQKTLGVTVRETVPDWVIGLADQVVNLDISAEDLRQRLADGKIYTADKVPAALNGFFTVENLTTLRELALREVASSVDRTREDIVARVDAAPSLARRAVDRLLVAMSSHPEYTAALLRKASRIAGRLNRDWYCVYVQTEDESAARIDAAVQRELVANIQRAQGMGAEVVKLASNDVAGAIRAFARDKGVTLIIVGQSHHGWWHHLRHGSVVQRLIRNPEGVDVLVVSRESPGRGVVRRDGPNGGAVPRADMGLPTQAAAPRGATRWTPGDVPDPPDAGIAAGPGALAAGPERVQEYARLLDEASAAVRRQLDETRMALHLLRENHFGVLNESQAEILDAACVATEAAETEAGRLGEIAHIDRGALHLPRDGIRVADLLRSLRPQLEADGARTGVTVTLDLLPGLPRVIGDRIRLQQALELLLRHLVRHAVPGSGLVIAAWADAHAVQVSVRHGPAPSLDADVALARRIIEAHGGSIAVTDQTLVTLPIAAAARPG